MVHSTAAEIVSIHFFSGDLYMQTVIFLAAICIASKREKRPIKRNVDLRMPLVKCI